MMVGNLFRMIAIDLIKLELLPLIMKRYVRHWSTSFRTTGRYFNFRFCKQHKHDLTNLDYNKKVEREMCGAKMLLNIRQELCR